jgi:hypothetical protein
LVDNNDDDDDDDDDNNNNGDVKKDAEGVIASFLLPASFISRRQ